jgi:hypothetical protein
VSHDHIYRTQTQELNMSTINPMSQVGASNIALPIGQGQSLATGQYSNPAGMGAHTATGNPVSGQVTGLERSGLSMPKPVSGTYSGPFMLDAFEGLDPLVAAMPSLSPVSPVAPFSGPTAPLW